MDNDDLSGTTQVYRLAKILWEATPKATSWAELVNLAVAAHRDKSNAAVSLVAEQFVLARAVIADGWHRSDRRAGDQSK